MPPNVTGPPRPTPADIDAARGRTIPDVIATGLRVVFAGINPGLYSAATGYHFARPGNRFWPALYRSGFTGRVFRPDEQEQLLGLGLGITNVVARPTRAAAELTDAELHAGFAELHARGGFTGDPRVFGTAAAIVVGDLLLSWADAMFAGAGFDAAAGQIGRAHV